MERVFERKIEPMLNIKKNKIVRASNPYTKSNSNNFSTDKLNH